MAVAMLDETGREITGGEHFVDGDPFAVNTYNSGASPAAYPIAEETFIAHMDPPRNPAPTSCHSCSLVGPGYGTGTELPYGPSSAAVAPAAVMAGGDTSVTASLGWRELALVLIALLVARYLELI